MTFEHLILQQSMERYTPLLFIAMFLLMIVLPAIELIDAINSTEDDNNYYDDEIREEINDEIQF